VLKLKAKLQRLLCDDDVIFMGDNINSIKKNFIISLWKDWSRTKRWKI